MSKAVSNAGDAGKAGGAGSAGDQPLAQTHQQVLDRLLRAFRSGRAHHTYLFHGPKGVGKRVFTQHFARQVLQKTSGAMADLVWLEPSGVDYKVDDFADLARMAHHAPFESDYRMVVISAADRLTATTANAILKILEEPPSFLIFVLLADEADRLLQTIRSRCQQVMVPPLPHAEVVELLQKQNPDADTALVQKVAGWSEGCLSGAQFFLDDVEARNLYEDSAELLVELWRGWPGLPDSVFEFLTNQKETKHEQVIVQALLASVNEACRALMTGDRDTAVAQAAHELHERQPDAVAQRKLRRQLSEMAPVINEMHFRWRRHVNKPLLWENLIHHLQPQAG